MRCSDLSQRMHKRAMARARTRQQLKVERLQRQESQRIKRTAPEFRFFWFRTWFYSFQTIEIILVKRVSTWIQALNLMTHFVDVFRHMKVEKLQDRVAPAAKARESSTGLLGVDPSPIHQTSSLEVPVAFVVVETIVNGSNPFAAPCQSEFGGGILLRNQIENCIEALETTARWQRQQYLQGERHARGVTLPPRAARSKAREGPHIITC
jgi:hypothetical protein